MFKLTIKTGNSAFQDVGVLPHIAELLEKVARDVEGGKVAGVIFDGNGNSVGEFCLTGVKP